MTGISSSPIILDDDSPPAIVCLDCDETLHFNPVIGMYDSIYDWFICQGFQEPLVKNIYKRNVGMVITFVGTCPIHGVHHTNNHFYIFWYYKMLGARVGDFLSCHHGDEKQNRIVLDARLPLNHLK